MYKLKNLINSKTNIWSRKIEILKSTNNLMKLSRFGKQAIRHHNNLESRKKVSTGLQEDILTRWRISSIYLSCRSMSLILVG